MNEFWKVDLFVEVEAQLLERRLEAQLFALHDDLHFLLRQVFGQGLEAIKILGLHRLLDLETPLGS